MAKMSGPPAATSMAISSKRTGGDRLNRSRCTVHNFTGHLRKGGGITVARWTFAHAIIIAMSTVAQAAADDSTLFDLCPPDERMHLTIETLPDHAAQAGLTRDQIRNAAESRLRAAGIYDTNADPSLYINVNVGPPTTESGHFPFYAIMVEYNRFLFDRRIPLVRGVRTWWTGSIGQGSSSSIHSSLSGHLDRFLVEYLRVRDSEACQDLRTKDRG